MNTFLKNTAILAVGLLSVLSSCSGDFLDNKPTDAVDSGIVPVPSNAGRIFNGAWYNLFEYSSTYANIGYRALMLQDKTDNNPTARIAVFLRKVFIVNSDLE